jgi:hypothetical protein
MSLNPPCGKQNESKRFCPLKRGKPALSPFWTRLKKALKIYPTFSTRPVELEREQSLNLFEFP